MSAMISHVTATLEAHFESIRAECDSLAEAEWLLWPEPRAFQGRWLVYPLVSHALTKHLDMDLSAHRARCPSTTAVLDSLPGIVEGGFSRLDPGTHIYPHAEAADSAHVRCHLGISIPAGAAIRIDGTVHVWRPGSCLVFDGHRLHEAANEGLEPRTILLCDYDPHALPRSSNMP